MEVQVTTFRSPFSFFCLPVAPASGHAANLKDILPENCGGYLSKKFDLSGFMHGQYVAVLWNDQWARGIISMETQCLIWLVDYGIYVRLNDKTVFTNLPSEDKRFPTKVFEASLHGIAPVDMVRTEMCEFRNEVVMKWSNGAIETAQTLIASAAKVYFVPIAVLSTKINDIVLGDLYLWMQGRIINLREALEDWPGFSKIDPEFYIQNLPKFYTNRRQHRASMKKPDLPELPIITPAISLAGYTAICDAAPELELEISEYDDSAEEGSTVTFLESACPPDQNRFRPSPEEIERYASMYITVSGREYNVLNVLCNKARDLQMCEKYADVKYIGRATSRFPGDLDEII